MSLPTPYPAPHLAAVREAETRIRPYVPPSPLVLSDSLSSNGREVRLKLESLNPSGSFKIRGAANSLLRLAERSPGTGVVTQSSGNHGRAIAFMAAKLGLSATVCVSNLVPEVKRRAIESLGARTVVEGKDQDEALEVALRLAEEEALQFVPAFDDYDIICGQGTLGLELLDQWPDVDTIFVPLSGGGLISGVALAAKALKPETAVIGVTVDHGAAMADSLEAGEIVDVEELPSYADALPGGIPRGNRYTFEICRRLLDGVLRIPESRIAAAMVHALTTERLVLEGAGAIGLAPLLTAEEVSDGRRLAVVCTGNNVDLETLLDLVRQAD
ncbi:MAG: pyridoxal-phosphate dependent enzyme [Thermoanaerobaculia bacterium]|nr:pyridoxal-phosphate dependent enzyme [Thermoanaerobaculia bacterium]